jgi:ubiquitin-conjugating enzyme E2 J2
MHTPSGRFQCSTRLCLSISDFHPKSFNPAWEVSTILIGLLSFMTSEEITTGSVSATPEYRKAAAARTRWWNSTGGGSSSRLIPGQAVPKGNGGIKSGDGGAKFRAEWPEVDKENWKWMEETRIDPKTGEQLPDPNAPAVCAPTATALRRRPSRSQGAVAGVVHEGRVAQRAGEGWVRRNKVLVAGMCIFTYVLFARIFGEGFGRT